MAGVHFYKWGSGSIRAKNRCSVLYAILSPGLGLN
jgi:hypothetical protein